MTGKNINYFLMDGTSNGCIKCTFANWTGVTYKIPRIKIVDCNNIRYLKQSGLYFLFSKGDEEKPLVYVGQASAHKNGQGVLHRLKELHMNPNPGIENWYEAIVFTTSNNVFGETEISWLKSHFFKLASEANRYEVRNGDEPNAENVTEEKESDLKEYINYAKIVMGVLGHPVFDPLSIPTVPTAIKEAITSTVINLEMETKKAKAYGQRTSEGFVVLKGSKINQSIEPSCPKNAVKQHKINRKRIDAGGILTEDILFKSANEAASFVVGYTISAPDKWKTSDGKNLKEIQVSEAKAL